MTLIEIAVVTPYYQESPAVLRQCHESVLAQRGEGMEVMRLIDRLMARGDEVLCVDNFFTGSKQNIAHVLQHPRFELIRHDVTFPLYVEVDHIYNLACPASPVHYQHDPVQTTKTSEHGATNMQGLAKRLDWAPWVALEQGLLETVSFFDKLLSSDSAAMNRSADVA